MIPHRKIETNGQDEAMSQRHRVRPRVHLRCLVPLPRCLPRYHLEWECE